MQTSSCSAWCCCRCVEVLREPQPGAQRVSCKPYHALHNAVVADVSSVPPLFIGVQMVSCPVRCCRREVWRFLRLENHWALVYHCADQCQCHIMSVSCSVWCCCSRCVKCVCTSGTTTVLFSELQTMYLSVSCSVWCCCHRCVKFVPPCRLVNCKPCQHHALCDAVVAGVRSVEKAS